MRRAKPKRNVRSMFLELLRKSFGISVLCEGNKISTIPYELRAESKELSCCIRDKNMQTLDLSDLRSARWLINAA